jgi:hypothetical protein
MTDVMERLAHANPVRTSDLAPSLDDVWRRIGSLDALRRCHSRRARRARSHLTPLAAIVAAGAACAALLFVGTTASGPTRAFAGWSPKPTAPVKGQIQAAESSCDQQGPPTLSDTRGPFTLLLFAQPGQPIYLCTSFPAVAGQTFVGSSTPGGSTGSSLAPDTIAVASRRLRTDRQTNSAYGIVYGYAGADVTGVTLVLNDDSQVQATTANGLFAAWWPGTQGVQRADIATTTGASTQALGIPTVPWPPGPQPSAGADRRRASGATGSRVTGVSHRRRQSAPAP